MIEEWKNINWKFIHRRFRTPFYSYILWEAISKHHNPSIKFAYEMENWLNLDSDLMVDSSKWHKVEAEAIKAIEGNPKFLIEITAQAYRLNQKIAKYCMRFGKMNLKDKSSAQLSKILQEYFSLNLKASAYMLFPMFFEEYLENILTEATKKYKDNHVAEEMMQLFSTPVKISTTQKEELQLLRLATKREKGRLSEQDIRKHIAEYGWLKNVAMSGEFYNTEELERRINNIINPGKQLQDLKLKDQEFRHNLHTALRKINKSQRIYVTALQETIFFRSWSAERIYRNAQYFHPFFVEAASRIGIENVSDIFYLAAPEIILILKNEGKADPETISERINGFIIFADHQSTSILSGKIVAETKAALAVNEPEIKLEKIIGRPAYPGVATAAVCLIKSKDDFAKMSQGSILVSHSTTPDYVPLMRMAAAIITDEGGVLSHASVISREMEIPCIIGTKNASKILKDGDMIEVDADHGTIKIIK